MNDERKTRTQRLQAIRELIIRKQIGNQNELSDELLALGFDCTQATLSRDLSLLKVKKVTDPIGCRRYVLPRDDRYRRMVDNPQPLQQSFVNSGFLSLNMSGNIAVIRTRPGYASSIAYHIDECHLNDILGTIAGDDTIFCVIREGVSEENLIAKIYTILK